MVRVCAAPVREFFFFFRGGGKGVIYSVHVRIRMCFSARTVGWYTPSMCILTAHWRRPQDVRICAGPVLAVRGGGAGFRRAAVVQREAPRHGQAEGDRCAGRLQSLALGTCVCVFV